MYFYDKFELINYLEADVPVYVKCISGLYEGSKGLVESIELHDNGFLQIKIKFKNITKKLFSYDCQFTIDKTEITDYITEREHLLNTYLESDVPVYVECISGSYEGSKGLVESIELHDNGFLQIKIKFKNITKKLFSYDCQFTIDKTEITDYITERERLLNTPRYDSLGKQIQINDLITFAKYDAKLYFGIVIEIKPRTLMVKDVKSKKNITLSNPAEALVLDSTTKNDILMMKLTND